MRKNLLTYGEDYLVQALQWLLLSQGADAVYSRLAPCITLCTVSLSRAGKDGGKVEQGWSMLVLKILNVDLKSIIHGARMILVYRPTPSDVSLNSFDD